MFISLLLKPAKLIFLDYHENLLLILKISMEKLYEHQYFALFRQ